MDLSYFGFHLMSYGIWHNVKMANIFICFFIADRMKINDLKMTTPIEEKMDQNLKVSFISETD